MSFISDSVDGIKARIFGPNLERIDYLIDSIGKLSPRDRKIVGGTTVLGVLLGGAAIFYLYVSSLQSLESELVSNHKFLAKIGHLQEEYSVVDKGFSSFVSKIKSIKGAFNLKSFLNSVGKRNELVLDFEDMRGAGTLPNVMRDAFEEQMVRVSIAKISLKKLVYFLKRIEDSQKFLAVRGIEINKRYDNTQYFRVTMNVASLKTR